MESLAGYILKKDEVKIQGHVQIGAVSADMAGCEGAGGNPEMKKTFGEPKIRIVQKNNEFAVIEVVCGCGRTTHIKCQYDPNSSEGQVKSNRI